MHARNNDAKRRRDISKNNNNNNNKRAEEMKKRVGIKLLKINLLNKYITSRKRKEGMQRGERCSHAEREREDWGWRKAFCGREKGRERLEKKERAQIEREKEQARTDRATRMHMLTVTETSEK